jgi:DNA replication protein DnaC
MSLVLIANGLLLLNDVAAASAILDRFLHHSEIIQFQGKSYRVEQATRRKKTAA